MITITDNPRPSPYWITNSPANAELLIHETGLEQAADITPVAVVLSPTGTPVANTVVPGVGVGVWQTVFTPTVAGVHSVTFAATVGGTVTSGQTSVNINAPIPGVNIQDARNHLNITSTEYDGELGQALAAAWGMCEQVTGKAWVARTVTHTAWVMRGGAVVLPIGPVKSLTTINGGPPGNVTIGVDSATLWGVPEGSVDITYVAGPIGDVVPPQIRQGVLEVLAALWARQRGGSNLPRQDEMGPSPWALPLSVTNSYSKGLWDGYRGGGIG